MVRFLHYHPITWAAVVVFALALGKGGAAERWGCLAMIVDWVSETLVDSIASFHRIAIVPVMMLDFFLALALLILALRYGKLWLGAAMIVQSVLLALHSMVLSDDSPGFYFYAASLNICTCLSIACLLAGTLSAWRRSARHDDPPSRNGPVAA